ncbi:MAG: type I restriction enzyme HsdR N-terminal domain-containing protein [Chlorobi bacterium]|nr:type I restriction enzyme HsdR N-terminal domain-containing protein [Chlorobiota bacterium]
MQKLNLPVYNARMKEEEGKSFIFDIIRKKYVVLTPEEWVRQNFIHYLIHEKKYSGSLMAVEKRVVVNGQPQRFDLLIYSRNGQPHLIAEFKAPSQKISQNAFDQAVRYNMALKVNFIIISNGLQHFICRIDYSKNSYTFLKDIPLCHNR